MEPTFNNYPLLPNNVGKESINNLETIRVVTTYTIVGVYFSKQNMKR